MAASRIARRAANNGLASAVGLSKYVLMHYGGGSKLESALVGLMESEIADAEEGTE